MSFTSHNRRHHVMSPTAQGVASKALAQLIDQHRLAGITATAALSDDLHLGRVVYSSAAALGFKDVGFGLYALATDDPSIPEVWRKEIVDDPVTGSKTEWLVAYTTDDDDIARQVIAFGPAVPPAPPVQQVQQQEVNRIELMQDGRTYMCPVDRGTYATIDPTSGVINVTLPNDTDASRADRIARGAAQQYMTATQQRIVINNTEPTKFGDPTRGGPVEYQYHFTGLQMQNAPAAVRSSQKTASMSPELRALAAPEVPKKNVAPAHSTRMSTAHEEIWKTGSRSSKWACSLIEPVRTRSGPISSGSGFQVWPSSW